MNVASETIRLVRPHHWIKNGIILLPVVFAMQMRDASAWLSAGLALAAFCLAAAATYAINDVCDRERDREHPAKRRRPVASGRLSVRYAIGLAVLLIAGAVLVAGAVNALVTGAIVSFLALQGVYSLALKRHVILDVMCIATGFVLRASAGALAIRAPVSPWLLVCTFTLCLFMGFCKRRNEVAVLAGDTAAPSSRHPLKFIRPNCSLI